MAVSGERDWEKLLFTSIYFIIKSSICMNSDGIYDIKTKSKLEDFISFQEIYFHVEIQCLEYFLFVLLAKFRMISFLGRSK